VELVEPRRREMVVDIKAEKEKIVDVDRGEYRIEEIVGEIEKDFQLEKVLSLPAGALPVDRILLVDNSPLRTVNAQAEADRVFFEGECGVSVLYAREEGESGELERPVQEIATVSWENESGAVKFAEFLEMPGVAPGMAARVTLEERGITAELVDERTIKVNLALRARAVVSEERVLTLVRDCALVPVAEKPRPGILFYLVQPGDTLWSIARRYQTTMDALCRANNLSGAGEEVLPGKKLLIPKTPLTG
jgi:LysM repeat protein